jgi:hypothetical protein
VSRDHPTADSLDAWIRQQYEKSRPTQTYYDSGAGEEECKAGRSDSRSAVRAFMAVQVRKTGDA